jgi:hypothetical protein
MRSGPDSLRLGATTLLTLALISLAAGPAKAQTYSYQGKDFDTVVAPYTTAMSISGSFQLPLPLVPNLPPTDASASVLSFSFTDGVETRTEADSVICAFELATGPDGRITQWRIALRETGIAVGDPQHTIGTSRHPFTANDQGDHILATGVDCVDTEIPFDYGYRENNPGTWTSDVAAVPTLPAVSAMLLAGLLALLGIAALRRRKLVTRL